MHRADLADRAAIADAAETCREEGPLTLLVNSLNRSLGQEDAYPFALSSGALEKLRYVHDVIGEAGEAGQA